MMRALAAAAAAAAACSSPNYGSGHLQCAQSGRACPSGFYCAADDHCWRSGSAPDLAVAPDLAAGVDLSGDPSRCAGLGVLLCDGFEAAALDAQTWFPDEVLGHISIDGTRAFRGTQSLRAHHDAQPATTRIVAAASETRTFPIAGTIYARAWAWFAGPLPATTLQPIILDSFSGNGGISYVIDNGHPGINDYSTPSGYAASGSTTVPTDRWTCLQIEITQSAPTGTTRVYLDGNLLDVSPLTAGTPSMASLRVGLAFYMPPALSAGDAWIDEVIVDDKPTTCDE